MVLNSETAVYHDGAATSAGDAGFAVAGFSREDTLGGSHCARLGAWALPASWADVGVSELATGEEKGAHDGLLGGGEYERSIGSNRELVGNRLHLAFDLEHGATAARVQVVRQHVNELVVRKVHNYSTSLSGGHPASCQARTSAHSSSVRVSPSLLGPSVAGWLGWRLKAFNLIPVSFHSLSLGIPASHRFEVLPAKVPPADFVGLDCASLHLFQQESAGQSGDPYRVFDPHIRGRDLRGPLGAGLRDTEHCRHHFGTVRTGVILSDKGRLGWNWEGLRSFLLGLDRLHVGGVEYRRGASAGEVQVALLKLAALRHAVNSSLRGSQPLHHNSKRMPRLQQFLIRDNSLLPFVRHAAPLSRLIGVWRNINLQLVGAVARVDLLPELQDGTRYPVPQSPAVVYSGVTGAAEVDEDVTPIDARTAMVDYLSSGSANADAIARNYLFPVASEEVDVPPAPVITGLAERTESGLIPAGAPLPEECELFRELHIQPSAHRNIRANKGRRTFFLGPGVYLFDKLR